LPRSRRRTPGFRAGFGVADGSDCRLRTDRPASLLELSPSLSSYFRDGITARPIRRTPLAISSSVHAATAQEQPRRVACLCSGCDSGRASQADTASARAQQSIVLRAASEGAIPPEGRSIANTPRCIPPSVATAIDDSRPAPDRGGHAADMRRHSATIVSMMKSKGILQRLRRQVAVIAGACAIRKVSIRLFRTTAVDDADVSQHYFGKSADVEEPPPRRALQRGDRSAFIVRTTA